MGRLTSQAVDGKTGDGRRETGNGKTGNRRRETGNGKRAGNSR